MSLATMLVLGGIAIGFGLVAGVLMRIDARADGAGKYAAQQPVKVQQARFPRSFR